MEVRVVALEKDRWISQSISVTMRTPGNDFELAAGFLFTEGIISDATDIHSISYCTDVKESQHYNVVNVNLKPNIQFDIELLSRHVYTTSSCGVCGKASLDLVRVARSEKPIGTFRLGYDCLTSLPEKLRQSQAIFSRTGGLHACGLFDRDGRLVLLREDVGRHNAFDKLVGALLLQKRLPASDKVVLVSGRASYELLQKAVMAGIPAVAAVGAPSSLAVDLAKEYGMTLVGFLSKARFNAYAGHERIDLSPRAG
jgi:FdhD protein